MSKCRRASLRLVHFAIRIFAALFARPNLSSHVIYFSIKYLSVATATILSVSKSHPSPSVTSHVNQYQLLLNKIHVTTIRKPERVLTSFSQV